MKRSVPRRGRTLRTRTVISLLAAGALATAGAMAASAAPGGKGNGNGGTHATGESGGDDLMASFAAFQDPRLSPSGAVTAGAYSAAWQHVRRERLLIPRSSSPWRNS